MDLTRLEEIFSRSLDLPQEDRDAFVSRECQGHPELERRVRELLVDFESGTSEKMEADFVLKPGDGSDPSALIGQTIGRYVVERQVAVGGMGSVFVARQSNPNREVALKLLRPELLGESLVRRFSIEVEVLGQLHHPNIAQVIEGGSQMLLSTEIPYFAMEYVPNAQPIDEYVRDRNLDVPRALRLFSKVCDAIHHAHLRGIIHRDLKPENILVDGTTPVPELKVIDFGIARFSEEGRRATELTSAGQIIGTLESMSPEQARGQSDEIDARTDVYALGVVLYEMLTGRPPLETRGLQITDALRSILEDDVAPPSTLGRGIRPELDAVVLKSLAKDKSRRYESVRAFQEDLQAFLDGRTVSAKVPSTIDVLRMTARRHRGILIPAAIVFLVAVIGAVVSTRFAIEARRNAEEARAQNEESRRLSYRTGLMAASAALDDKEAVTAATFLEDCPPELRAWEWKHLSSRLQPQLATFPWQLGPPYSGAFRVSPDGRFYAGASRSPSEVGVWSTSTGELLHRYPLTHDPQRFFIDSEGRVYATEVTPSGGNIHRWSQDGEEHETWPLPPELPVDRVTLGEVEGRPLALASQVRGNQLILYDLESSRIIASRDYGDPVDGSFVGFGDRGLVAVANSGTPNKASLEILDPLSLRTLRRLDRTSDSLAGAINVGRWVLAHNALEKLVHVWDLESDRSDPVRTIETEAAAWGMKVSDDGRVLVAGGGAFSLEDGRDLGSFTTLTRSSAVAFLPGTHLLLAYTGDSVQLLDLPDRQFETLARHRSFVYPVEISERSGLVLSGGWDGFAGAPGCLRWTDRHSGAPISALGPPGIIVFAAEVSSSETEVVASFTRIADGSRDAGGQDAGDGEDADIFAMSRLEGRIARVSMSTGEILDSWSLPRAIHHLALEPNYERVVTVDRGRRVRVIDIASGRTLHESQAILGVSQSSLAPPPVAWSPDGRWIAVTPTPTIEIWDARTYEVAASWEGHERGIQSAHFDAESRRLVTASSDRSAKVWSLPEGRLLAELRGQNEGVKVAKFNPDGTRIASGDAAGDIRIWSTDPYEQLTVLRGHEDYVFDLEWTKDGRTLITSSGDGTVRTWDTITTEERVKLRREREEIVERVSPEIEAAFASGNSAAEVWEELVGGPTELGSGGPVTAREYQVRWQETLRRALN